jgi:DNA-directed RNA polymerase subunit L
MDPKIKVTSEENNILKFTLSNVHTSLANSLRRIALSDINTVVFKTFPHSESKVNIITNTCRFNNEILKQRIGCIPIHITDNDFPIDDYSTELDVKNNSDSTILVTTKDLKIKNIATDKYITDSDLIKIFPPDPITSDYIPICRLRPKFSENMEGEHLHFVATFSYSNAKTDGMYNVVSTCAYGNTIDSVKANDKWNEKQAELQKNNMSKDDIKFEKDNWFLLDGKRIYIPNSFDFIIESVGVFSNFQIINKSCDIMINKCKELIASVEAADGNSDSDVKIETNENSTITNEFIITLKNQDYTMGYPIVYFLYEDYYNKNHTLTFVGFRVPHPHIPHGIIRMGFKTPETISTVVQYIIASCNKIINVYSKIKIPFSK